MIVCIDKQYSASKLLLLGGGSSALFPAVYQQRIHSSSFKTCSGSRRSCNNFQPTVLHREGLSEQHGPELLEERGGKVRDGTKAVYILGKLMEKFEVCSQWIWKEGQHSCSTQPQKQLTFCTFFPPSCFSTIYSSAIQDNHIILLKHVYLESSSSQTNNILQPSIFLPSITDKFLALNFMLWISLWMGLQYMQGWKSTDAVKNVMCIQSLTEAQTAGLSPTAHVLWRFSLPCRKKPHSSL